MRQFRIVGIDRHRGVVCFRLVVVVGFIVGARLVIGVRDLAAMSGVNAVTVSRFETGQSGGRAETLQKLQAALEAAGVEFISPNGGGPGVRLKSS